MTSHFFFEHLLLVKGTATLANILILVIRFMADLLQKYRGSVVIMVGRGGASPTMFITDPL